MEWAPDPSLGHDGSAGDARCVLDHLPDPCDYVDKKGKACTEYGEDDPDYVPPPTKTGGKPKTSQDAGVLVDKRDKAIQE